MITSGCVAQIRGDEEAVKDDVEKLKEPEQLNNEANIKELEADCSSNLNAGKPEYSEFEIGSNEEENQSVIKVLSIETARQDKHFADEIINLNVNSELSSLEAAEHGEETEQSVENRSTQKITGTSSEEHDDCKALTPEDNVESTSSGTAENRKLHTSRTSGPTLRNNVDSAKTFGEVKETGVIILEACDSEQKEKKKRKSRLSLNSDAKNKTKFKEGNSQASIVSFFQKMSPKIQGSNKCGEHIERLSEEKPATSTKGTLAQASFASQPSLKENKASVDSEIEVPTLYNRISSSCEDNNRKNDTETLSKTNTSNSSSEIKTIGKAEAAVEEKQVFLQHEETDVIATKKKSHKDEVTEITENKSLKKGRNESTSSNKNSEMSNEKQQSPESNRKTENEENFISKLREEDSEDTVRSSDKLEKQIAHCETQNESPDTKEHKKVRFSEEIREFSPEPVKKKSVMQFENRSESGIEHSKIDENITIPVKVTEEDNTKCSQVSGSTNKISGGGPAYTEIETIDVEETNSNSSEKDPSKAAVRNAFTFMMDNRHKSIGQNSPGKEVEELEESSELRRENKKKLSARKTTFQNWADSKGATKRKLEDEQIDAVIEHKLNKRAKRLKKMLTQKHSLEKVSFGDGSVSSGSKGKRKKKRIVVPIIDSDTESIIDVDLYSENMSEVRSKKRMKKEERSEKHKHRPKKETGEPCSQKQISVCSLDDDDDALDNEVFNKRKKHKVTAVSNHSDSECHVISEGKLSGHSESEKKLKNNSAALLQQTELSSFFGTLNKTDAIPLKSRLRMRQNVHSSDTENSVAEIGNRKKNKRPRSKLTLRKSSSSITSTSDDLSNSPQKSENDCSKNNYTSGVRRRRRGLNKVVEKSRNKRAAQMVLTPRSVQRWKMRLRVKLAEADDQAIERLMHPHVDTVQSEDDLPEEDNQVVQISNSDSDEPLSSKGYCKKKLNQEKTARSIKPLKLAPLFIRAKPKPKLDEATIEARRKFLHSGIPDSLKKIIEKQQRVEEVEYQIFPTVSHITVKPTQEQLASMTINFWNLPLADLNLMSFKPFVPEISSLNVGAITNYDAQNSKVQVQEFERITNLKKFLKLIKSENTNYPVYKAFKFLHQKCFKNPEDQQKVAEVAKPEGAVTKPKRGRPRKKAKILMDNSVEGEVIEVNQQQLPLQQKPAQQMSQQDIWTDLYRPCKSEDIFGNRASIMQLKAWLESWLEFGEEISMQRSKRKRSNSDSSSDFESTDADSKDSSRLPGNTVILCGPNGSGKTTAVYALCNELGINVLEVNASSKRAGKWLLQELQEATQSHQVRKQGRRSLTTFLKKEDTYLQNSQNSDSHSSTSSQKMCLLLIEDVDIVFEQDESFVPALSQLLTTSKRPLVLTTTDSNCLHLKRFFVQYPVITFAALSASILATWLQVLCLVEGVHVDRQAVAELLEENGGDVRRTLLQLQFWVQSGGQPKMSEKITRRTADGTSRNSSSEESLCGDDSSNISWLNTEETVTEQKDAVHDVNPSSTVTPLAYLNDYSGGSTSLPLDLGDVWWNFSGLLNLPLPSVSVEIKTGEAENTVVNAGEPSSQDHSQTLALEQKVSNIDKTRSRDLRSISDVFEALAVTDVIYKKLGIDCDLEPVHRNGEQMIKNSLEVTESLESYCASKDSMCEWSHTILKGYTALHNSKSLTYRQQHYFAVEEKRWRMKQHKCKKALLEAVPISCYLDRCSVNLDYYSTLRTIVRSEVIRASTNIKRGNRFYNYLRGLGVSCNDSLFRIACRALCRKD